MRTYALDRIKSITVTDQNFVLPIDFDGEVYFKYCFGIINNGSIDTVQIKVRNETNKHKYFKSLPLHPSQMIIEENSVFTIFQYELRPTYDFKQELMSHIPEIEVISPSYLRQEIICMLKEQLELYSQ